MSIDPLHRPPPGLQTPHALHTAPAPHTTRAPEPHPPAAPAVTQQEQFQRARNEDRFETPVSGPGGSSPHLTLTPESAELRQTTPGPQGQVTTRTAGTNGQNLTAGLRTEGPGGVRREGNVTADAERLRISGSRTDAAGGTQRAQVDVAAGGGSVSASGEFTRPGDNGLRAQGSATLNREGASASGQVSRNGASAQAAGSLGPNGWSASGGVSVSPFRGASLQFNAAASRNTRTEHDQGMTTVTTQGEVSLRAGANLQAGGVGVTGSDAQRTQTTFQVRMRDEDHARVQSGQAPQPNPYDPTTLPQGGSVLMRESDSRATTAGATFRNLSAEQGTTSARTQSLLVERTGPNTVRMTSGPESTLENSFRVGFSAGGVSGNVTLTDSQQRSGQRHADFDLSTEAGRTAYTQALATRQLPQANGPGVSGVESQERIQLSQGARAEVSAGGFNLAAGITNEAELTSTRRPDGSEDRTARLNNNASIPVSLQRTFRPDGGEDESQRRLSLNIPHADAISAGMLYGAFTGNVDAGNRMNRGPTRDVQLNLTQEQVQQLQGRMREYVAANPTQGDTSPSHALIQQLANARTPQEIVLALGQSADPARLATAMALVAGEQRLPGSFTVSGPQP